MLLNQAPGIILYLAEEDLFRLGNAGGPRLDNVRKNDVDLFERNGFTYVRANGRGISLATEEGAKLKTGGWLWKLPARTPLPNGLLFNHDGPTHYSLCPAWDMSLKEFEGLLIKLAVSCVKLRKV